VLVMTGRADLVTDLPDELVLAKPFGAGELAARVANALARGRGGA
jgi:DNA-binding response OmpR family regulator